MAYMGQGHQPQEAHAPRYKKKGRVLKGEGTSEVPWGGWTPPPLLAAAPDAIWRLAAAPRGWETLKEESQQGKAPPRCLGGEDSSPGRRTLGDWIS